MPNTRALLAENYKHAIWTQLPLFVVGVWLIASPAMLSYESRALVWNDISSGFVLIGLVLLALARKGAWTSWAIATVGGWLLLAPIIFWAPTAEVYTNDTIAGLLIIAFAVVIPYMESLPGPDVPAGWDYNPSSWSQRLPIIILALISFLIARYMSSYQLGHIQTAWDPFFTPGTVQVLESQVSKSWPVSDAGVGAVSYALDAIAGLIGGVARWRTMPWIVVLFGIFIFPLGIVSITLVILQPVAVGAWCTLCLLTAFIAMLMIPFALDEVGASLQFLWNAKKNGMSLWDAFWFGGDPQTPGAGKEPERPITLGKLGEEVTSVLVGPWNLLLNIVAGIWLMAAPAVLGISAPGTDNCYITGALVITFAIISFVGIARSLRFLITLIGLWVAVSPWVLGGFTGLSQWVILATGVVIAGLSLRKGRVKEHYGMWDPYIV